jgi:hypothetical protein
VALLNTETKIPQLLLDYVESRRVALSIPAADELAFFACVPDTAKAFPCVVFYCESFELKHSEKITLNLRVDYINELGVVDSTEESAITSQVRSAIADIESWKTWLLALSSLDRTGWRILKTRVTGGGIEFDADMAQRRRWTSLVVHCITSETTFPN